MIGGITGDVIGSVFEWNNIKTTQFPLISEFSGFTDDTVLTVAIADALLNDLDYSYVLKKWGNRYPRAGYGGNFILWLNTTDNKPYNSWGNGSAMRVSPIGYFFDSLEETLKAAKQSAEVTHNHPEGIKGAQATAAAIYLARTGKTKQEIKEYIESNFNYDLSRRIDDIRLIYSFDVSCQGSVPESIIAFLESEDFESAIRLAISLGGDSDTIACITGSIAHAFYKEIDEELIIEIRERLPMEMLEIIDQFKNRTGW